MKRKDFVELFHSEGQHRSKKDIMIDGIVNMAKFAAECSVVTALLFGGVAGLQATNMYGTMQGYLKFAQVFAAIFGIGWTGVILYLTFELWHFSKEDQKKMQRKARLERRRKQKELDDEMRAICIKLSSSSID